MPEEKERHTRTYVGMFAATRADSCFLLLSNPLAGPPFDDTEVATMSGYFHNNLNVKSTGAVVASPGAVPALNDCCPGGYDFHWMRDGALSLHTLMDVEQKTNPTYVNNTLFAYAEWVGKMQANSQINSYTEPKWWDLEPIGK